MGDELSDGRRGRFFPSPLTVSTLAKRRAAAWQKPALQAASAAFHAWKERTWGQLMVRSPLTAKALPMRHHQLNSVSRTSSGSSLAACWAGWRN